MWQSIKALAFLQHLFDDLRVAERVAPLVEALWAGRSPRLSDLARYMPGRTAANYKRVQRLLRRVDLRLPLQRLYRADAPFVIGNSTDMPRPQAYRTPYVGKLADGQCGFWLLVLATPYRGRALPFGFVTFSSRTIAQTGRSRNQYHWQAFEQLKNLVGDKPLVLDRDFSYADLLEYLTAAGIQFVIRLNLRSQPPTLRSPDGRKLPLAVGLGEQVTYRQLRYCDRITVNLAGIWRIGCGEPLWVISNLPPEQALTIYHERMKIDETFRDLKHLLNLDRLMNKSQFYMEQLVALTLLAFTIACRVGEALRDTLYSNAPAAAPASQRKWRQFSGLFLLLREHITLPRKDRLRLVQQVAADFAACVCPTVRTHV
jgi:hypothetical protein